MSALLALRYLGHSLKHSSTVNTCGNLFKCHQNILPAAQTLITKVNNSPNLTNANSDEWRIMYQLPMIRLASAFNSVKVPYGILNAIVVPALFALEHHSQIPPPTALLISSVGVTSWCTLAIFSFFIRNLVGIIYINDKNDKLKLAYVDYWGKRNDVCVKLDDVIPESEKPNSSKVDFYQSICLYSDKTVQYKLLQRFGNIEDPESFASIFGE